MTILKVLFEKLGTFEVTKNENGSYNIFHVDIFRLGESKGFDYSLAWAEFALGTFNKDKNESGYLPPVIIGHNDFMGTEEKPARGFMDNFQLKGDTIYADFVQIPADVFEELKKGAYPYRSIEVVPSEFRITAIALLGGTEPYFKLTPLANFSNKNGREGKSEWVAYQKEESTTMTKEEQEKFAKAQEEFAAREAALAAREKEVSTKEEQYKKAEEEASKARAEAYRTEVEAYLQGKLEKGKLTPAMKDSFTAILHSVGTNIVKFNNEDKSVFDVVKQLLEAIPQSVSFSIESNKGTETSEPTKEQVMHDFEKKVEEAKQANPGMKYRDLIRKVTSENKELANQYQKFMSSNAQKVLE